MKTTPSSPEHNALRPGSSLIRSLQRILPAMAAMLAVFSHPAAAQTNIFVTTTSPGVTQGLCSLQEAIYSSELRSNTAISTTNPDVFYTTGCVAGTGNGDTIVLPTGALLNFDRDWDQDSHNIYGPTATPIIFSKITIEGNGATLQWQGSGNSRLFAIGTIDDPKFASGTGDVTLRNVYVKGFHVKGGDGGLLGGGGGLGAGGAIFLAGLLVVENSTFDGNSAIGGNGNHCPAGVDCLTPRSSPAGGGGGGFSGNGGDATIYGGSGGGGARGDGGHGGNLLHTAADGAGGGGGGTVFNGAPGDGSTAGSGGFACGGKGGGASEDAQSATCDGGGGGGGGGSRICSPVPFSTCSGNGGSGGFGAGGGGGAGDGGNGGFGGGGGAGNCGFFSVNGGNGGFGGGGGAASALGCSADSNVGQGGVFGGRATRAAGGGGGALGGAIFNYIGTLKIRNSTFTNNFVARGVGFTNGADAGGAVFSFDNTLEIFNSTFSANQSTGSGAAISVYSDEGDDGGPGGGGAPVNFILNNTVMANNGDNECFYTGGSMFVQGSGNLIMNNAAGLFVPSIGTFNGCPGVVTKADPHLGPLQINAPGGIPTMAITSSSSAFNTANSGTSLAADQRGVDRPQAGKPDIGAYEACVDADPKQPLGCSNITVKPPPPSTTLTVKASSSAAGTISPAPGSYNVPLNTVTILTTTPNPGFCFQNWIGNVTSHTSPSTTVIMDQALGVTANFVQCDFFLLPVAPLSIPPASSTATNVIAKSLGTFSSPVSLSVNGQPSDVVASLAPGSVTPPAGGSVNSVLSVRIGPSVVPQTFTLNVAAISGALTHSNPVNVAIIATNAGTANVITALQNVKCLAPPNVAKILKDKLALAQNFINGRHTKLAIDVYRAMVLELQGLAAKKVMPATCTIDGVTFSPASVLIADVRDLMGNLTLMRKYWGMNER